MSNFIAPPPQQFGQVHAHAHQHQPAALVPHAGMGHAHQPQLFAVYNTPNGPEYRPYSPPGLGQAGAAPMGGMAKLGTYLVVGGTLFFAGRWLYQRYMDKKSGGDGVPDGKVERERVRFGSRERGGGDHKRMREAHRSRSRLASEFRRWLDSHASEEA